MSGCVDEAFVPREVPRWLYTVKITKRASKEIEKLPIDVQKVVVLEIESLSTDLRPRGCKKLTSSDDSYRIRTGNYRIIYQIDDGEISVNVVKIGHRKQVYK